MEDQGASAKSTQDRTVAEGFAEQLRTLRKAVGDPSFRKMAGRSGCISHTTLHEAAAGTRFPSWETTREFVRACDADEAQWRRRWEDARCSEAIHAVPDEDPTPATGELVVSSDPLSEGQRAMRAAEHPQAMAANKITRAQRYRVPALAAAAVAVVAMFAILGIPLGRSSPGGSATVAASPSSAASSATLVPGDSSMFIADVTIPDGTQVKVNAHFVKVWALANVGTVYWHNRFLAQTNPTGDDNGCRVPDRVMIGDTPPGAQVMISVPVTAPTRPGKCWVGWKMVDEQGQAYFPSRRPVYFMVTVVA